MSGKPKFAKLRLPRSSTRNNGASNSQISSFFSKSSQKSETTTTKSNDNSRDSCISDSISIHSNDSTTNDQFVSLPEQSKLQSPPSELDPEPLQFASFEVSRPSKLRRVDLDSTSGHGTIKEFFSGQQPNENDFENQTRTTVKKATNLARTKKPAKSKGTSKKQPKIRNVLLKREQILSNFIAEQSIAENVDPNEMQMALALSRSEVERCGVGVCDNDDSSGSSNTVEVIRDKLEEFGYRVGRTYGGFGAPKGRGKWANKFTALTLRDPDQQQEKINKKIEEFLNSQYTYVSQLTTTCTGHFAITSDNLSDMKPLGRLLHSRHADYEEGKLEEFYVEHICKPTGNKIGNLLKDYRCIPGRDKSPLRMIELKKYEEEGAECQMKEINESVEEKKTENSFKSDEDVATTETNVPVASCSDLGSTGQIFLREPSPDLFDDDDEDDLCVNSNSDGIVLAVTATSDELTNQSVSTQQEPPSAPVQAKDKYQCMDIVSLSSESNSNGIATCERFSSDDVKTTVNGSGIWNQDINYLRNLNETKKSNTNNDGSEDNIIDLTQAFIEPYIEDSERDQLQRSSSSHSENGMNLEKPVAEQRSAADEEQEGEKVIDLTQGEINMNEDLSQDSHDSMKLNEDEHQSQANELKKSITVNDRSRENVDFVEYRIQDNALNQDHQCSPSSQQSMHFDDYSAEKNSAAGDDFELDNIIDLTQAEINTNDEYDVEQRDDCRENNENENLSQTSECSIIILSDDEVNYSIKVAKGIGVSSKTADESDEKDNSFGENDSNRNLSQRDCEPNLHEEVDTSLNHPADSSSKNQTETSFDSNLNSPNGHNNDDEDLLNYSLAHEIMSHSFQEEFERVETAGLNFEPTVVSLTRMRTDDIVCLDLTDPTPPDEQASEAPSSSRTDTNISPILSPPLKKTTLDYWTSVSKTDINASLDTSNKLNRTRSDSCLLPKSPTVSKPLKRFSSSRKFNNFISEEGVGQTGNFSMEEDEFDRLVYGNLHRSDNNPKTPGGINKLLLDPIKSPKDAVEEMTLDDRVYLVRTQNIRPKPDYQRMDSPTRLKELYKYGLKPLKRKQAIIMLEYIYNQTHPCLVDDEPSDEMELDQEDECNDDDAVSQVPEKQTTSNIKLVKYGLSDCCGSCLLLDDGLSAEIEAEEYIFQTNTRSKIHTARLPLHIAWYNLVRSNQRVREAILYYEPIDLQEIYGFLKGIGYRYDPKDIKRFFDRRSIIFQYDLNKEGSNRHVRNTQKQGSKKTIK